MFDYEILTKKSQISNLFFVRNRVAYLPFEIFQQLCFESCTTLRQSQFQQSLSPLSSNALRTRCTLFENQYPPSLQSRLSHLKLALNLLGNSYSLTEKNRQFILRHRMRDHFQIVDILAFAIAAFRSREIRNFQHLIWVEKFIDFDDLFFFIFWFSSDLVW